MNAGQPVSHRRGDSRPLTLADQGCFYVGGSYDDRTDTMSGQAFVQYQIPAHRTNPYPLVLIHGGGQTGAGFWTTPDRRPGWADIFVAQGFAVYVIDVAGRGRAQGHDLTGTVRTAGAVAGRVQADHGAPAWPQATLHTQWPGTGRPGDVVFDQFYASQVAGPTDAAAVETAMRSAGAQLLDEIGSAILLTHSQGAPLGWQIADERPELTSAVIAVEPTGPPVYDIAFTGGPDCFQDSHQARPWGITAAPLTYTPHAASAEELSFERQEAPDGPGLVRYWRQSEPARRLSNLARTRILLVTAQASYHAPYDHGTSAYLTQAGVAHDFVRLADHGIYGNGHMMMLEQNNAAIAEFLLRWIAESTP